MAHPFINMKFKEFFKSPLIWFQVLFFVLGQTLGLLTAYQILYGQRDELKVMEELISEEITFWHFLIVFFLMFFVLLILLKFIKGNVIFDAIFYLALGSGIFIVFMQLLPIMLSAYLTFLVLILYSLFYKVWIHNLFITLGLAGIAVNLGLRLSVLSSLIILAVVSVYDYVTVIKTKQMVNLFKGLVKRGVILSLVIPQNIKNFNTNLKKVKLGGPFMFLGTGDLAFPLIFAISVIKTNLTGALLISLGAVIGTLVTQFIFLVQKERKPIPAIPLISLFSVLGYLISI